VPAGKIKGKTEAALTAARWFLLGAPCWDEDGDGIGLESSGSLGEDYNLRTAANGYDNYRDQAF
jgi:hypothetical protein